MAKRTIVAISKTFLPESIKAILRRWLMARSHKKPLTRLPFHLVCTDGIGQALIDGYPLIKTTAASQFDFEHLFQADWQEFDWFLKIAVHARCFFDIGASRGVFSAVFATMNSSNNVYAFEASAKSCSSMKELFDVNSLSGQIHVVNTFVGDKEGSILASQEECGYVQAVPVASECMIKVPMLSVDDFCSGITEKPNLLKIDVEGFEHEVLMGAKNYIKDFMPVIMLELHLFFLENRGIDPCDTLKILEDQAYLLYDLCGCLKSGKQHVNTFERTIKILAVHERSSFHKLVSNAFAVANS